MLRGTEYKKTVLPISEVSEITGLKPYVLRYWETEFKQLAPPKNRAGNRTFRQKDIDLIQRLRQLLHVEKFTIEGARKKLSERVEELKQKSEINLLKPILKNVKPRHYAVKKCCDMLSRS